MKSKYNILSPYFSGYSMTRSGMTRDHQQGHNVFLTSNWERPNYSCSSLFIRSEFYSSIKASNHADELNAVMIPILDEIVDVYHDVYINDGLGNDRIIVQIKEDGKIGWSLNKARHDDDEFITRGDKVILSDGHTPATILFVFNDSQLKNKLKDLGRH